MNKIAIAIAATLSLLYAQDDPFAEEEIFKKYKEFGKIKEHYILDFDRVIRIYDKRLLCLQKSEIPECVRKYPLDQSSDQLALLMSRSFPKSYYVSILKRDKKTIEKMQKCVSSSTDTGSLKRCLYR